MLEEADDDSSGAGALSNENVRMLVVVVGHRSPAIQTAFAKCRKYAKERNAVPLLQATDGEAMLQPIGILLLKELVKTHQPFM